MTNKKEEEKKEKDNQPKKVEEKLILYEAVQDNPHPLHEVLGALSYAGLIRQYYAEEEAYGVEDIEPSITNTELTKIIKKFIGE